MRVLRWDPADTGTAAKLYEVYRAAQLRDEPIEPPESLAVMVWFSPVTEPAAGTMAPWPSALPMASTEAPALTPLESPIGTVRSPEAFCSWIRATSPVSS